ncbi:MAG: dihydroxyacetone kinase subunit DhaK [Malacoplasma sp.]|nr:dihydroxyacetone kinase subunit DhaK [Malacoplasma sp.]
MKKIINKPENILNEMVEGFVLANPDVRKIGDLPVIARKNKAKKVSLISGGGSGHEPSHAGFVGEGMLDAAVCGEIFTSPSADKVYEAIKGTDSGMGTLLIIKNYSGDVMNFEMAADMASAEGINVKKVIVNDDIAVENSTWTVGRRGVAGTIFVHKILGAAAEKGYSLDQLEKLGNELIPNIKTIGMATKPCYVPTSGKLSFELKEDEIEMGVGIHGEPGTHKEKAKTADEYVEYMTAQILKEIDLKANDEVALIVNGLGDTTLIELFIVNSKLNKILSQKNIKIVKTFVGNYMTSLDMGGFSISVCKLNSTFKELLESKANTPALKQ